MADARRPQFGAEHLAEVRRLQGLYPDKRGALLPVLHLAQDTFGHISLEVEEYVAGLFELSPAHVHEVVTFYTLYFQQPKGRHVVAVCHNLSCHLLGAKGIIEHLT
ncbi:MAG TPA: NAD(P)H-dependent oxidoreductase subunit E, partial [Methylomirabilota bacterium]|nr:NAD(P)H-dependent oxidoreductase subunit E [Methylomirabilota bacterium]